MAMKRRSLLIWLGWAGLLGKAVAAPETTSDLSVKGNVVQGNPLFLTAQGAPDSAAECRWAGQTFHLGRSDQQGRLRAVLPVAADGPSGSQSLTLKMGELDLHRSYTIAVRNFSIQHLTINAGTLASYDDPRNRADDEEILKVAKKSDPTMRWTGNFRYPIQAPETTAFGARRLYNGWKKGWHKGIDLGGREGESVYAPGAGKVVLTAQGLVNGNTVVISHGCGLTTIYYHLQSIGVENGQSVTQGQAIGRVGGTGGFAPHLHWEARVWGVPIDPKSLFQMPDGWR